MFYYVVVAYKQLSEECRTEWKNTILRKCALMPAHIVEEFGKNGDSPHLNIIIENRSKEGKNFRERIKRMFPVLYPQPTNEEWGVCLKGKGIRDFRNLGNVINGYLTKESKCEVLQENLLTSDAYKSLEKQHQEFSKIPDVKHSIQPISNPSLFNLVVQIYNEEYDADCYFTKDTFKEIIKRISKHYMLLNAKKVVDLYPGLESYINNSDYSYLDEYIDNNL